MVAQLDMRSSLLLSLTLVLALPISPDPTESSLEKRGDRWVWGAPQAQSNPSNTDVQSAADDNEWPGNHFYWPQLQQQPEQQTQQSQPNLTPSWAKQASSPAPNDRPGCPETEPASDEDDENARILKLSKQDGLYTTVLKLGSNSTPQQLVVDTGSSDIWVNTRPGNGDSYDYQQSALFKRLENQKPFRTNDRSQEVSGFWGSDAISLFGSKFRSTIGFAESSMAKSTLGLGPKQGEALADITYDNFASNTYPNLPILLKDRRLIEQAAYSLWLNNDSESYGNLVFGAVDHAKYAGDLQKVPIVDGATAAGSPAQLNSVMLSSISTTNYNGEINKPVTLDSSTEYSQLPMQVYQSLAQALNANIEWDSGNVYVDCNSEAEVTFDFSGIRIPVKVRDLAVSDGQGQCTLPVRPRTDLRLGNVVLKNLYTVYDLDSREIAIASALHGGDATRRQLESITSGIPRASHAPNYSSTEFGASAPNPWQGMW